MRRFNILGCCIMVVMTVVCATFASCSSGSNDDDIPGDYKELKEGVHRIEIYFSGSNQWKISAMFIASYGYNYADIYENNQKVNQTPGGYYSEELRNYVVETGKKCDQFYLTLLMDPLSSTSGDIEVTLRGYIDGKQDNMKVWTIKASNPKSMMFSCQNIGADLIQ